MTNYAICFGLVLLVVTIGLKLFRRGRPVVTLPVKPITSTEELISTFDSVSPVIGFNVDAQPSHPYAPWSGGKFQMAMGIRRTQEDSWLMLDNRYREEQSLRERLLDNEKAGVLQYLDGSEDACRETLEHIVAFLTRRFPDLFFRSPKDLNYLCNGITGAVFRVVDPLEQHPLEIAARLVMEDMNLLIQGAGPDPDEHYLRASFSMAPAGWYLKDRIGWPLWQIHTPVPMWEEKLRKPVEKYFRDMKVSTPVERMNFFMQTDKTLFQQEPFAAQRAENVKIQDVQVRHERQTLRRLPQSRAILFMVRTYLTPVVELASNKASLYTLRKSIRAMPEEMAKYKGREAWGDVFEKWAERELADYEPSVEC
ncbi:hypothetical protein LTR56_018476 [Elasticomyces elasticus]|nr:hypothetical protein LTR56_018476 [Elasticomyces elasticus]KAK3632666.1 hypothetical protein LTR22_020480 [Elasticomyces elasticus]KAK4912206.1 hypothetical protein LTR49_019302 [Elasticomyces elasticus]KAK5769349.1 hypothetical protein LTS12_000276 [Elasticomyces elasticus]